MITLPRILLAIGCFAACTCNAQEEMARRGALESGLRRAIEFRGDDGPVYSIRERMSHYKVPGLSVAVINDGRIEWVAGYGSTESTGGAPVNESTLFQAASVSKAFVAVAAMRMRDAGLVDLDKNIDEYLKEYVLAPGKQTADNPVTLRNLLSHSSGITPGGYAGYVRGEALPTDIQILRGEPPANSRGIAVDAIPGTAVAYSGGGYTLVEVALQDLTDTPFERLMEQWIVRPLGLRRTTFEQPLPDPLQVNVAAGYAANGERISGGWRVHPEQAAAGMWTTAADLAAFVAEIGKAYGGQSELLSKPTASELLTEQLDGEAIGLVIRGEGSDFSFSHAGGNVGYRAYMILYPMSGDGAVYLTNSDNGQALGDEILRAASTVYAWPDFRPRVLERHVVSPDSLARLAGTYHIERGGGRRTVIEILFDAQDAELAIRFPNGDVYSLESVGPSNFIHPDTGVTVDFDGAEGQEALTVYGLRGSRAAE